MVILLLPNENIVKHPVHRLKKEEITKTLKKKETSNTTENEMKMDKDKSDDREQTEKIHISDKNATKDKQVDLREILKSKKSKDKSKSVDEASESHPLKRRKSIKRSQASFTW